MPSNRSSIFAEVSHPLVPELLGGLSRGAVSNHGSWTFKGKSVDSESFCALVSIIKESRLGYEVCF